jgi:hypothetical protein
MSVGVAWSGMVVEGGDDYAGTNDVRIRVVAEEEIDTPLGRLKTLRIERTGEWRNTRSGKTGTTRWTYWYHGPAKQALRYQRTNTTAEGRLLTKETQELVAYGVK